MNKLKSVIYAVFGIIVCSFLAKGCFKDYAKGGNKTTIANCEKIIADKSYTTGELNPNYTEVTVKIMRIPTKTYQCTYSFKVENNLYGGAHTYTTLPTSDTLKVYYLKSNPKINYLDPATLLKEEKNKNTSNGDLYWAIGWCFMVLLMLVSLIGAFKNKKETETPE